MSILVNPRHLATVESERDNYSHEQAVSIVARLSNRYRQSWAVMKSIPLDHLAVIRTLKSKKIPFVLTGMHGIASWLGRPRATHDIDLLVRGGNNYARAVRALKNLYPELEVRVLEGISAFFAPGEKQSLIDVAYPMRGDLEATLDTAVWIVEDGLKFRVPSLEAALANKFGAAISPSRPAGKRGTGLIDFYNTVLHSQEDGRAPINLQVLARLGEKVLPSGGGAEILRLVDEAKADRVPVVTFR